MAILNDTSFANSSLQADIIGSVDWRVWALTSTSVHLLILLVCFVLVCCDKWPSFHHRRIKSLNLGARIRIKQVVDENWDELLTCAKDLIDARLEDGWSDFSERTENCEKRTFDAVKALMSRLPSADGEEVTYLQRELKRRAMRNSADLRGSQRLSLLCDFIGKQNPGCWEKLKRCCLGFLPSCSKKPAVQETSGSPSRLSTIKKACCCHSAEEETSDNIEIEELQPLNRSDEDMGREVEAGTGTEEETVVEMEDGPSCLSRMKKACCCRSAEEESSDNVEIEELQEPVDLGRDVEAEEETVVEIENSPSCLKRAFYCLLPACLKNKKTAAEQETSNMSCCLCCLKKKKASSRTGNFQQPKLLEEEVLLLLFIRLLEDQEASSRRGNLQQSNLFE